MVMVEVNSNVILVELIKNQTSDELQCVYLLLLDRIMTAEIVPKKHVLDNECSEDMKELSARCANLNSCNPTATATTLLRLPS